MLWSWAIVVGLPLPTLRAEPPTAASRPVDFDTQIAPLLTKAGCNSGICHGGATGRGGFKLSLFGADPASDYRRIVRALEGRRVDLERPAESLVFLKPTAGIEHGGGLRFPAGSAEAGRLRRWLEEGARRLSRRRLVSFEVSPERFIAAAPPAPFDLRARAVFDDGTAADVTRWTVFTSSGPRIALEEGAASRGRKGDASAAAAPSGRSEPAPEGTTRDDDFVCRATVTRRGRGLITARFLSEVVAVPVTVALGESPVDLSDAPRGNLVDEHILESLETLRLEPAPLADPATFIRRARLALTGTLPSPAELRAFLSRPERTRRLELVDRLLASPDFVDYWSFRLARLLRVRSLPGDTVVARRLHDWIRGQLVQAVPYDDLVHRLIVAEGDSHRDGAAGFHRMSGGPRKEAEHVSDAFLGVQLECANCHDHPLDRWTQDDYHGLAAVFARLDRGRVVRTTERGEVTLPGTGKPARPRIPGRRFLPSGGDGRAALAQWLTSEGNPYFARAIVNRLWKSLMGRGLVEPASDLRSTNPPTHPALLDALARDFVEHGCRLRRTLGVIGRSRTFARASGAAGDPTAEEYARYPAHGLDPEVLVDAICRVTGVGERFEDYPRGTRAIQLASPQVPSRSLDVLGRCSREGGCEAPPGPPGLAASLHLINGPLINDRIADPGGVLPRRLAAGEPPLAIVEGFYRRALARAPRPEERRFWRARLEEATGPADRRALLEDFLWSLLTSREFTTVR